MPDYKLSKKAVEDLSAIWNYTYDKWSEKQADLYYKMLLDNCAKIAENPLLGKNYEGILDQFYGLRAGNHIIFYRKIEKNLVEITRILHERMDLENRIVD